MKETTKQNLQALVCNIAVGLALSMLVLLVVMTMQKVVDTVKPKETISEIEIHYELFDEDTVLKAKELLESDNLDDQAAGMHMILERALINPGLLSDRSIYFAICDCLDDHRHELSSTEVELLLAWDRAIRESAPDKPTTFHELDLGKPLPTPSKIEESVPDAPEELRDSPPD